ncbi:MarR family transcriptional regulator [Nitriliruptor alkaliphilus]|uniref:MarR family transcriptional regulator n=1 Tax=Nitriliruptor alkaliphilus TaxID=427918 RepID=UPI000696C86E|nr:MarR family transcriptional regulator [Nitriliruptor alkaliphilus]
MATPPRHDPAAAPSARRRQLLAELELAGRASSAATVLFHAVVAEKLGLSATQEKMLDLVSRLGPLTPRQLAEASGLAPASVTGVLDALGARGFIRRVPNPDDRRSVLIELETDRVMEAFTPLYTDWVAELQELYAGYRDDQLETIAHFLREAARRQHQVATALASDDGHRVQP